MIRRQDLVRELKELVHPLLVLPEDESSSSSPQNRIQLQQCQTVIQHHEAWLSSILIKTDDNEGDNRNEYESKLHQALQQVRLQLLLQQNNEASFADIVQATSDIFSLNHTTIVVRAYALYQLQEYEQVLDLLDAHDFETSSQYALAAFHLQAQSFYHLHDYPSAMEIYETILEQLEDSTDDDVHEVFVNYMAAHLNQYSLPYCPESNKNRVTIEEDNILASLLQVAEQKEQSTESILDLRYNVATYQLLHRSNAREAKLVLQSRRAVDNNCHNQYEWSQHFHGHNQDMMKGMQLQTKEAATSKTVSSTKDPWLILQYYHDKYETLHDLPENKIIQWTLLQDRLFDYNRCVALLHQKQYDDCRLAAQDLWATMAPDKPPEKDDPSVNDPVLLWWEVRLAVLLLYCPESVNTNSSKSKKKSANSPLELRSTRALEFALMSIAESPFRDHMLVYLQLHQAAAEEQFQQQPSLEELYADWPPSMRTKPAVQATMVALQQSNGKDQLDSTKKSPTKETALLQGHWHFNQGNYPAAVECYEITLTHAKDVETKQMIQARLVLALTHIDPDRAMKLWDELSSQLMTADENDYDYDVQAMEALENSTQRWNHTSKGAVQNTDATQSGTTAVTTETIIDTTIKSRDSVLKQRAKRRAQYLDQLQKKGLYNPERPTQPDPERWIPKYDRAANRRRKKNNAPSQNKHQGTGAISEKDLAKLDVAARQNQPKSAVSNTTSTAHISASGARSKGGKRR